MIKDLYKLADEKIEDVYKSNADFDCYLKSFYSTKDAKYLTLMWPIIYRCSANILKRKFGSIWSRDDIVDKSIDICCIILSRVTNFDKWKDGYVIKNLPSVVKFAVLNVSQSAKARKEEEESKHISYELIENYENFKEEEVIRGICRSDLMNTLD